jgi:hypothetical protein
MSQQNSPPAELTLEVFRAGDYGPKGNYTPDDLESIAADYNPSEHEAPVTLDHQQQGPAHGWVTSLQRAGDRLVATIARVSPTLGALLKSHAYKKRSVEFYRQHGATGRPYLKAVSFLGAAAPEVKGLADPLFHESVAFEEEPPLPPAPGRIPASAPTAEADRFVAAGATADSAARHRQAIALMSEEPSLAYRDALLRLPLP